MKREYIYIKNKEDRPLMQCGHMANMQFVDSYCDEHEDGTTVSGYICLNCKCTEVETDNVDLTGRKARCPLCGREVCSDFNLSGFHYKKQRRNDIFYCGCSDQKFIELSKKN